MAAVLRWAPCGHTVLLGLAIHHTAALLTACSVDSTDLMLKCAWRLDVGSQLLPNPAHPLNLNLNSEHSGHLLRVSSISCFPVEAPGMELEAISGPLRTDLTLLV